MQPYGRCSLGSKFNSRNHELADLVVTFNNKLQISTKTSNPKIVHLEHVKKSIDRAAGNTHLEPVKKSSDYIARDDPKMMLHWLIQRGYAPETAKMLVMVAYGITGERPQLLGRVFRCPYQTVPVIWEGELPARNYVNPTFSRKVFIGGVPWDITESDLLHAFGVYGACSVEWPVRSSEPPRSFHRPKAIGYVYMIFDEEDSIRKLLQVQVIPWVISDTFHVVDPTAKIEREKTVFVGALHGMLTSQALCSIMNDLYGSVVFVGLDNDKYKYPIGSGRVTFSSSAAFFRAIEDGFLVIRTTKFTKRIQIDPFLEYAKCSRCNLKSGTRFCRDRSCFKHYCITCWEVRHSPFSSREHHKSVVREPKRNAPGVFVNSSM